MYLFSLYFSFTNLLIQLPHMVQQMLYAEKTPILGNVVPQSELFITSLEDLGDQNEELKPITNVGVMWAMKYYQCMDYSWMYAIAMCESSRINIGMVLILFSYQPYATHLLDQKTLGTQLHYESDQND